MKVAERIKCWIKEKEARSSFWRYLLSKFRSIRRYILFCVKDAPLPAHIQLEPTTKCNCRCITCDRNALHPDLLNKDMTLEQFKTIISQIPTLKTIQLSGLGEPLLCDDLEPILEYGASKGVTFTVHSNATMINDQNIDLILKYFKLFTVSFDSATKENYEKIRVGADFDKVINNIKKLARRKKETGAGTRIILYFIATHLNFKELPLFFELCDSMGIDGEVGECLNWAWAAPRNTKEYQQAEDFIDKCRMVRDDIRRHVDERNDKSKTRFLLAERGKNICYWPFSDAYITVEGYVMPCCMVVDRHIMNFGNVFEKPFYRIWNSKEYKNFRKTIILDLKNRLCDECFIHTCDSGR